MKKLFTAIRHGDIETVKTLIENKPELVNCTAKQPPKKDDGQSPLQVAIKTNNFETANYLLDNGADVNFIESDDSYDDWRMPVLNHAVLTAVINCRHNVKSDLGDTVIFEEFSSKEIQQFEKEFLGFYVTSHPLSSIRENLPFLTTHKISEIKDIPTDKSVTVCGLITACRTIPTKKDPTKFMKFFTIEDLTGKIEVLCFTKKFKEYDEILQPEEKVIDLERFQERMKTL